MNDIQQITRERVYLFISDAHLGGFVPEKNRSVEKDLISMIDYAESMDMSIVILGDLFDYWMEYPGHIPDIAPEVLKRFESLHRNKPGTLYITGNHDNWTDNYLKKIGFDVEPEYRILDLNGKRVFLMHGDGLSSTHLNLPRPLLHRMIRNSYFVSVYKKWLPAHMGIALMRSYSKFSRKLKFWSTPGNSHLDSWAINFLKKGNADVLICGHHHKPLIKTFGSKIYMNLGNFFDNRTAGLYANDSFHLVAWDGSSNTFTTRNTTYASY
ncbi:MAG: UDP-2,3-diacylglucosamine diphosphatase [Balneolales bacterium]